MQPMSMMGAPEEQPEEELTGGQKALRVMRSLAGTLGGAAYAAGVSGASQNPWAGPHALAQLRDQGVRQEMFRMQQAAQLEHKRRQTAIMDHMQQNFSDMSDPNQRQAAIQYLMSQGAYEYAQKASSIFSSMYGDGELAQKMDLETHKSELAREESTHDSELKAMRLAGKLDYKDVSKMGADYDKQGGKVFKALKSASSRIETGYQFYLNAKTPGEKAQAYQTMVVALNKLLDPNSVVRESEFERTATYQSMENKLKSALEQIRTGSVTPEVMAGVAAMGRALYKAGAELQAPIYTSYVERAKRFDFLPEDVLGGFEDPNAELEAIRANAAHAETPPPAVTTGPGFVPPESDGSTGNSGVTFEEIPR
jgi:hypothetical protein